MSGRLLAEDVAEGYAPPVLDEAVRGALRALLEAETRQEAERVGHLLRVLLAARQLQRGIHLTPRYRGATVSPCTPPPTRRSTP